MRRSQARRGLTRCSGSPTPSRIPRTPPTCFKEEDFSFQCGTPRFAAMMETASEFTQARGWPVRDLWPASAWCCGSVTLRLILILGSQFFCARWWVYGGIGCRCDSFGDNPDPAFSRKQPLFKWRDNLVLPKRNQNAPPKTPLQNTGTLKSGEPLSNRVAHSFGDLRYTIPPNHHVAETQSRSGGKSRRNVYAIVGRANVLHFNVTTLLSVLFHDVKPCHRSSLHFAVASTVAMRGTP